MAYFHTYITRIFLGRKRKLILPFKYLLYSFSCPAIVSWETSRVASLIIVIYVPL